MLENISGFIIHFIQSTNYLGIFVLMLLGSSIIPFPSEITLPFSGFLASNHVLSFLLIVVIAAVGDLIGSLILFTIGYFLEEALIVRMIDKYGRFALITKRDYIMTSSWFLKYGDKIVFFAKLLPAFRHIISLLAGIFEMNIWRFCVYAFLGSLIWAFILTYTGLTLGNHWNTLGLYVRKFEFVVIAVFVLVVVWYVNYKLRIFKSKK